MKINKKQSKELLEKITEIKKLRAKKKATEAKIDALETEIKDFMEVMGLTEFDVDEFTIRLNSETETLKTADLNRILRAFLKNFYELKKKESEIVISEKMRKSGKN